MSMPLFHNASIANCAVLDTVIYSFISQRASPYSAQYKIMLLGVTGTKVETSCPKLLPGSKQTGSQTRNPLTCCPQVAAVSCIQKTHKNHVTLTFELTLKFNRLLEVVEVHVRAKFN